MADPPGEPQPTIFCAWCRRVIEWGGRGISHGLCTSCLPTVLAEIRSRLDSGDAPAGQPHIEPLPES